jgi:hypothetical protein
LIFLPFGSSSVPLKLHGTMSSGGFKTASQRPRGETGAF